MTRALDLRISKEDFQLDLLHGTEKDLSPEMKELRPQVLKRDKYTCHFCDWRSKYFMEIHHLDHNHKNNKLANLVTACPFCHKANHLVITGILKTGKIIFLPELTQEELNNFCINLFMAAKANDMFKQSVKAIYGELLARADSLNDISESLKDPSVLALSLLKVFEEDIDKGEDIVQYLRVLPSQEAFDEIITEWAKENKVNSDDEKNYFMNVNKYLAKIQDQKRLIDEAKRQKTRID